VRQRIARGQPAQQAPDGGARRGEAEERDGVLTVTATEAGGDSGTTLGEGSPSSRGANRELQASVTGRTGHVTGLLGLLGCPDPRRAEGARR
jgi:hypothetical protein